MANRMGAVAAYALSYVLRPLGYIIFGALMIIYRRDPRAIAYFLAGGLVIAALVYGISRLF